MPLSFVSRQMALEPEKFPALRTLERFRAGVHGAVFFELPLADEPPRAHFTPVRVGDVVLDPRVAPQRLDFLELLPARLELALALVSVSVPLCVLL